MQITQIGDKNRSLQCYCYKPSICRIFIAVTPKHPAQLYEAICYVFLCYFDVFILENQNRNKAGYLDCF